MDSSQQLTACRVLYTKRFSPIRVRRPSWRRLVTARVIRLAACVFLFLTVHCFNLGYFTHPFETNYNEHFQYPLDDENIETYVTQLMSKEEPYVNPINRYNYGFIIPNAERCVAKDGKLEHVRLLLMVKSAVTHFDRRSAIRNTWCQKDPFPGIVIKCVFNLGVVPKDVFTQQNVLKEQGQHGDIIQADFVDNYYNNTIKTMMSFRWIMEYCSAVDFVLFIDDDMYVSIQNVLIFLSNPLGYPDLVERRNILEKLKNPLRAVFLKDGGTKDLFAGWCASAAPPMRDMFSKWYITLSEYPYHLYPPYVTAGAMVMSRRTVRKLYYYSFYTQHFRFDDIFLGIVARKAGVSLVHNEHFHYEKLAYVPGNYDLVIISHGYENPQELVRVWSEQDSVDYSNDLD